MSKTANTFEREPDAWLSANPIDSDRCRHSGRRRESPKC
jgi:hypothetical protein